MKIKELKRNLPPALGAKIDEFDVRDLQFAEVAGAPPADMPDYNVGYDCEEKVGKLRDDAQGSSWSCVAHGGTNDIEMSILATTGKNVQLSQRDAYSQIYLSGGGAAPRDFYKLAQKSGICEDEYLLTRPNGNTLTEAYARTRNDATDYSRQNALKWRIGNYYSVNYSDMDLLAQAIYQNNGCGSGYKPLNGSMGHFVFFKGYGIHNGLRGIRYKDSYYPYDKWIVKSGNNFYLDSTKGTQVSLFSSWTFDANSAWTEQTNMAIKLERKENEKPVLMVVNDVAYWLRGEDDFNNFAAEIDAIKWENVKVVKEFSIPYDGKVVGYPNFADIFRTLFGVVGKRSDKK